MDGKLKILLTEVNKLHARKELAQNVGMDYFEPGMMEHLDKSDGQFNAVTGEILIRFEVKGTCYEGRTEQIEKVQLRDEVVVRRVEKSSYYVNNYELLTKTEKSLGYMPTELCNAIAPLHDCGRLRFQHAYVSYVEPISQRSRYAKKAVLFVEVLMAFKERSDKF